MTIIDHKFLETVAKKELLLKDITQWLKDKNLWEQCLKDISWSVTQAKEEDK